MKERLQDVIRRRTLLGDGAMGTQLMLAGLEQGNCGEEWNLTHPERVLGIQRAYVEAGSDCLLTNTFGGSRIMLNRHGNADSVVAINQAGVEIAREAFGGRAGYVIGDIGPFGGLMEPYGDFTEAQVRAGLRGTGARAGGCRGGRDPDRDADLARRADAGDRGGEGRRVRRASSAPWRTM